MRSVTCWRTWLKPHRAGNRWTAESVQEQGTPGGGGDQPLERETGAGWGRAGARSCMRWSADAEASPETT